MMLWKAYWPIRYNVAFDVPDFGDYIEHLDKFENVIWKLRSINMDIHESKESTFYK